VIVSATAPQAKGEGTVAQATIGLWDMHAVYACFRDLAQVSARIFSFCIDLGRGLGKYFPQLLRAVYQLLEFEGLGRVADRHCFLLQ
jgi:hypothetical protein